MKLNLPSDLTSVQDLVDLIMELRAYARFLEHQSIKSRLKTKHNKDDFELTDTAKHIMGGSTVSPDQLDNIIKQLDILRTNSNVMTITLASSPNDSTKKLLIDWCRKNIASDILFSFKFNQNLLGGMVLRYKSRIFDWSFRRKILENKQAFPGVLKNVQ